jgi:hypothetical protein
MCWVAARGPPRWVSSGQFLDLIPQQPSAECPCSGRRRGVRHRTKPPGSQVYPGSRKYPGSLAYPGPRDLGYTRCPGSTPDPVYTLDPGYRGSQVHPGSRLYPGPGHTRHPGTSGSRAKRRLTRRRRTSRNPSSRSFGWPTARRPPPHVKSNNDAKAFRFRSTPPARPKL